MVKTKSVSVPIITETQEENKSINHSFNPKGKHKSIKGLATEFKARILRKVGDQYIKIGEKSIKNTDTEFRFLSGEKAVTFIIPENLNLAYTDGKTGILYFDFDSGILGFNKSSYPIHIKTIDDLVTKNVIAGVFKKISNALDKPETLSNILKWIAVGGICIGLGLALGYILGRETTTPQIIQDGTVTLRFLLWQLIR